MLQGALALASVRLLQLLDSVPIAQNTAKIRNSLLPGMWALKAQTVLRVGTTAGKDVTPADHMKAFALGLAFCIEALSGRMPNNGETSYI